MARPKGSWNPIAFVPLQVSLIASAVYIALAAFLLYTHHHVPSAPSDPTPVEGLNLTQAWLDLTFISDGFHPEGTRRNEEVRAWIVDRVRGVVESNGVDVEMNGAGGVGSEKKKKGKNGTGALVTVFEDNESNVTFVDDFRQQPWTCYQEATNVMVYVRGEDDKEGSWWEGEGRYDGPWGVLVNAHYDSVSSGYGATDDGVGVVTLLQLISHFSREGNRPQRGIVFLFNNGEENGLYGAHNYLRHPLSQFTHTFLNLEGAGAGGRAVLFRSTDAEVTKFYAASPRPYGSVVFDDGFKRGLVRSGTDYSVFAGDNGMRGLDVAFFEPRSRYHTDQDSARETSPESVWHMLSTALATTQAMTSYSGDAFDGSVLRNGRLNIGSGAKAVWFDIFNRTFALLRLPTLFALSVTLLVAAPVILIVLQIVLAKADKWYPLTKKQYLHSSDDDEPVHFSGMRGLLRFPIAFIVATAAVLALAYLLTKINPYIVYSSEYAVWAMMLSAYFSIAWFFLAGADRVRPTALHRMYTLIWLFALSWVILVAVTVGENNYDIASGYLMVIFNACVFVALLISYLELFALPKKADYVERMSSAGVEGSRPASRSSRDVLNAGEGRSRDRRPRDEDDEADERTSLLRGRERRSGNTFTGIAKRQASDDGLSDEPADDMTSKVYGDEQAWSSSMPRWTWIVQFVVLAPINIILMGQVALLTTSALHQTPADGSPPLTVYLLLALLTTLLLLPLTPFLHRFVYQIPTFLFLIFVATLIYNLLAFPFSRSARLKVFFTQSVDLDSGANNVTLTGLDGYVQAVIDELPSSTGKTVDCGGSEDPLRASLRTCSWAGLPPHVVPSLPQDAGVTPLYRNHSTTTPETASWLSYNISHTGSTASFTFRGNNTKACRLILDTPASGIAIADAAHDPRYHNTPAGDGGSSQVRLFSREWDKTFRVNVTWDGEASGKSGKVVCLWADANERGVIPAYDELRRFAPVWAAGTKGGDGLVEGWKRFVV